MDNKLLQRIKQVSQDKGLTCRGIASDLGDTYNNVYRYVNGLRQPPLTFLNKFARVYDVNYEWLMTGVSSIQKKSAKYEDIKNKELFLRMIEVHKSEILRYLRGQTNYHEPYVVKTYRNSNGYSRKEMQRLMICGYRELGLKM